MGKTAGGRAKERQIRLAAERLFTKRRFHKVTMDDVDELFREHILKGKPVERLRVDLQRTTD